MLFGRRKPGYTTTVDGAADPEQVVLDLQKAEMAAKKKPKAEVFSIDAASETARRLKETGSTFDGSAAKAGEDVISWATGTKTIPTVHGQKRNSTIWAI